MAWTPSRTAFAAITACVVLAGAGAGILLQPSRDRPAPAARGPNVSIDVVAPREPEPEPGSVMDVGDLADGYTHSGYPPRIDDIPSRSWEAEDESYPGGEPRRVERPREIAPEPARPPVIADRREPSWRWPFGFDQPRPDYAAERRERRARIDERRLRDEARMDEQRSFEEAQRRERFDDRGEDDDWRDEPRVEASPDRDGRDRRRQWYRADGSPVQGPDAPY